MKYFTVRVLGLLALFTLSTQCYYDDVQTVYGTTSCDTSAVTWNLDIQPLFQAQCVGCHGATSPSGGLSLSNYTQVSTAALAGTCMNRINKAAGDPLAMPPTGPLSSCQKAQIRTWIRQGALQN